MTPTFNPGTSTMTKDIVLVQKYNIKKPGSLSRRHNYVSIARNPEKLLTKRVVGIQGDIIRPKSPPYPKSE